jgi:hypothetical protein
MKKKILGIFVCMLLIITVVPVTCAVNIQTSSKMNDDSYSEAYTITPANSQGLINIKIVAKVAYVSDPYNLLEGAINVGDTIKAKYTYDPSTSDTNTVPTVGDYWHTSPSCGIEVKAGGFVFTTDPSDVNFLVEICNDHGGSTPIDNYLLRSYNNLKLSNDMLVDHISWQLDDDTATAVSSTDLPTKAPVLDDWESIFGLMLEGSDPSDPLKTYLVRAHATKATKTKAKNIHIAESEWSNSLQVPMLYYKSFFFNFPLLNWFFERFPNTFPILKNMLRV